MVRTLWRALWQSQPGCSCSWVQVCGALWKRRGCRRRLGGGTPSWPAFAALLLQDPVPRLRPVGRRICPVLGTLRVAPWSRATAEAGRCSGRSCASSPPPWCSRCGYGLPAGRRASTWRTLGDLSAGFGSGLGAWGGEGDNKIICWGDHPAECSAPSSPQLFQLSTLTSVRLRSEPLLKPRGRRMQLGSVYLRHLKTPARAVPSVPVSARHWTCTERSCPSHFIAQ